MAQSNPPKMQLQVLQGKIESTSGTEETSGFVEIPVFDVGPLAEPNVEMIGIQPSSSTLDPSPEMPGLALRSFPATTYVDGRGTYGAVPPWMSVLLQIGGFVQTSRGGGTPPSAPTVAAVTPSGAGITGTGYKTKISKLTLSTMFETEASAAATTPDDCTAEALRSTFANPGAGYATVIYRNKSGGSSYFRAGVVLGDASGGNQTYDDELTDTELDILTTPPTSTAVVCWLPISENHKSATLRAFLDGQRRNGVGCRTDWTMNAEAGRPATISFATTGRWGTNAFNQTNPLLPSFPGQPPRMESSALQIIPRCATGATAVSGGTNAAGVAINNLCWQSLSLTPGMSPAHRSCGNADDGVIELSVQDRFAAAFGLLIEDFKGSTYWDMEADMVNQVRFGCSFIVGPAATSGTLTFIMPNLQLMSCPPATKDRAYLGRQLGMRPLGLFGNDWLRIERTA